MVGRDVHGAALPNLRRAAEVDAAGRPWQFGSPTPGRVNRHNTGAPMIARPSATPFMGITAPQQRGADWLGGRRPDLQSSSRRLPPPEHLLPVVQQLLTGATDLTASRQLGLSPRTYSRRVSELLEYLGVESRFQAGVEAARRGWLPHPRGASESGSGPRNSSSSANRTLPVPRLYDVLSEPEQDSRPLVQR